MTVSAIFPVHDCSEAQATLTTSAFTALIQALDGGLGEVVVVDDGSPCRTALRTIADNPSAPRRIVHHERRRGLVSALNTGARTARCDILTYCHSDCVVASDALSRIADLLSTQLDVGMAVSELYFPDGRLQQAGGWIGPSFQLCWSTRIGAAPLPIHWGDFWSVRRELYPLADGLPEVYNPGYWECVDLAAGLRHISRPVVTCPGSRVVHHKSQTFHVCFDQHQRNKLFERNRAVFAMRWRHLHDKFVADIPGSPDDYDWR
jgi:O-antigen biosynthesis protein